MPPKHARYVSCFCLWDMPSCVLSFCWVTAATLSLHEHRVAVGTAADSLRHLHLRALRPILDCASSMCFPFVPLLKIIWASCLRELTGAIGADYGFPFPEKISVLADGSPGNDREAVCSLTVLHNVRRFELASMSMFASFLTLCPATLNICNQTSDLRRSYRHSLFHLILCIRGALEGGDIMCNELSRNVGQ